MNLAYVIERSRKVLDSCKTYEQVCVSRKYGHMLITSWVKYNSVGSGDDMGVFLSNKDKEKMLRKWFTNLVTDSITLGRYLKNN